MKKKFIAIVALAAMMLTMLPFAAFATDNESAAINIEAINFNNNTAEPNDKVIIRITGSDVKGTYSIIGRLNGTVLDSLNNVRLSEFYVGNGEYLLYIPKSEIPDIDDASSKNVLAVSILDTTTTSINVLKNKDFEQSYVPTMPTTMDVSIDNGTSNTDRALTVAFDSKYVPDSSDRVSIQGVDKDGDAFGKTYYIDIEEDELKTNDDDQRVFALGKFTFDDKAIEARVTFIRNNEASTTLTEDISLEPPYGELKEIVYDFGEKTVARGETITGKLIYINKDNERHDITDEAESFVFSASDGVIASQDTDTPTISISQNAPLNGNITAMIKYNGNTYYNVLSVVDQPGKGDIKIDKSNATVDVDTPLTINLLDEDGQETRLGFTPSKVEMRWIDSSSSSATPVFTAGSLEDLNKNGKLLAATSCSTACSGKFELTFSDDFGRSYTVTSDTFTYSNSVQKVELTIGSTIMKVDGVNKTMEVAPLISGNRTYVPLRAFSQAVGATVLYVHADNRITIDLDDIHIVMTPGSNYYTVNNVQKYTDAAPYIMSGADRTMVPFRVIGEALGYNVNAISRPDGSTSGVVFTAK